MINFVILNSCFFVLDTLNTD